MAETCIIVGLDQNQIDQIDIIESLEELRNLCDACEIEVVEEMVQKAPSIHPSYYLGTGKMDELAVMVEELQVELVVFNHELTPTQIRNIKGRLHVTILDKTALILQIFSRRAKTREAKLQVEISLLQYELPRLVGSYEYLGRQGGGMGTTNRGSGEKKLQLDKRKIEERIHMLNQELEQLQTQRETRSKRREHSTLKRVALVGYTNAGKSTVMNALLSMSKRSLEKQVLQKDMLFATLETSVRNIHVEGYYPFLLSDTVGFVSDLPHTLVKAFRSTLQEVKEADLLLHIVDRSNPGYQEQIAVTNETLASIGAGDIPMIYVYNKIDLVAEHYDSKANICISAFKREGMDRLLDEIQSKITVHYKKVNLLLPYNHGDKVPYLMEKTNVINLKYKPDGYEVTVECSPEDYLKLQRYEK